MLIHIVAVPLFVIGIVSLGWGLVVQDWARAGASLLLPVISLALQGRGHKLEPVPPRPFTGLGNFLLRIFSEQFFRFWRFFLSGRWFRVVRGKGAQDVQAPSN